MNKVENEMGRVKLQSGEISDMIWCTCDGSQGRGQKEENHHL